MTPTTNFGGAGYDGTWASGSGALVVNTAQADGALANHTLSIGTVVDSGNTFVTINGTEISGVLANEVTSITLANTNTGPGSTGVKFDLSAMSATDFSNGSFAVTVTGLASDGDTLATNNTAATWSINAVDGGSVVAGYTTTFTNISNIVGGSGNNTFDFAAGDDVDGSIDGGAGANSFDFSNGGSAGYTTNVSALVSDINAGSITANDTFTFANIGSITGGSGANTYTFDDTSATPSLDSVTGYGSSNTLDFGSVNGGGITVDVTAPNSGDVGAGANVTTFSDIQTINGSAAGSDLYQIEPAAYTGSIVINGGVAGGNELSYPGGSSSPVFVNLQTNTATGVSAFTNIDDASIAATANTNTLTGANAVNAWEVSAANAGGINGDPVNGYDFTFSGFNVLNGGTAGDAFTIDSGVTFNGAINGNTGADTLSLGSAGQTVSGLTDGSSGFSGSVATVSGGFTNIDSLTGAGATNTLNGENAVATWNLDDSASQYTANSHTLTFDASFHTLNGGSGGDTFTLVSSFTGTLNGGSGANTFAFDDTSVLTGSIVGNTGTDTLDYSSYDNPIAVTLTADTSSGFTGTEPGSISGTFGKIDAIIGTGNSLDSLTGENGTATWTLGASPYTYTHSAHGLSFNDIANLNGGTGADTFNISNDFQGNLDGGLGNDDFVFTAAGSVTGFVVGGSTSPGDTLDYSGYGSGVNYSVVTASATTGATGAVTGIGVGFSGITNLIGSTSYTDSLTVVSSYTSATWTVSGGVSGTNVFLDNNSNTFNFAKIENLIGSGGDTFNVTASHTGDLTSPSGTNAFNVISNSTTTVTLTGNIYGGTGVDTVTINGNSTAHPASVTGNIVTGGGGDFVHLTGHASVGGQVNAGASNNGTLSFSGFTTSAVTVNIATGAATAIDNGLAGGIAGFTAFVGANNASDKLTGPNTANGWDITGNNSGTINTNVIVFSQFKNLFGGTSSDTFVFEAGMTVTSINGGGGANTADFTNYAAGITAAITGANAGTINTNAVTFTAIGSLVGSSSNASTGNTWQFKANGSLSGSISSGNSLGGTSNADSLTYNSAGGYTKPVTVDIATQTATLVGGTFNNVFFFTGSSSTANTFVGVFANDTVTITGANAGYDLDATFTRFQNLTGNGGGNTFAFNSGGSISGKVNGGTGSNTLDISAESGAEAVSLATGAASFTGGFLNINTLVGNDNAGTSLTGANVISTWTLTASDAGTVNSTSFSGFAKLVGGSLADDFVFSDTVTIQTSINGGAGNNTMDLSNYSSALDVAITANNGGSVAAVPSFANIQNITGGSGGNDFDMYAGHGVTGALNGGSGRNSLDYTRYTTAVTVNLGTHAATNVGGGATNFKDVYGSLTAKNTITGDGGNDVLIGGAAVDTISASASGTTTGHALIIGGGGKDSLTADNGWDILIGGSTSLSDANLDDIAVNYLAGVNSSSALATAKAAIETAHSLSASVTTAPGSTINNGATGNDWDILNVITTLKKLKTAGDIRTFE